MGGLKRLSQTVRTAAVARLVSFFFRPRRSPAVNAMPKSSLAATADSATASLDLLILDPQPVARTGTFALLSGLMGNRIPRQAETAAAAWSLLAQARPELFILELSLNGPSGLDFIRQVLDQHPGLPILVFSAWPEEWYADRALRAGARGYVMKSAEPSMLVAAVRRIMAGHIFVSPEASELIVSRLHASGRNLPDPTASLSDRELEVLLLIGQAFGTSEIARRLRVSVSSIESYRAGIKRKLGLSKGAQLVHAAVSCMVAAGKLSFR